MSFHVSSDETDYTPIDPNLLNVVLMFNNNERRACFNVTITNDMLVEGREAFTLLLVEDPFLAPPIETMFNESVANVTILDQDGRSSGSQLRSMHPSCDFFSDVATKVTHVDASSTQTTPISMPYIFLEITLIIIIIKYTLLCFYRGCDWIP